MNGGVNVVEGESGGRRGMSIFKRISLDKLGRQEQWDIKTPAPAPATEETTQAQQLQEILKSILAQIEEIRQAQIQQEQKLSFLVNLLTGKVVTEWILWHN